VLVVGAGLMIRTLMGLLDVRTGMSADPAHVFMAEVNLPRQVYAKEEQMWDFDAQLLQRLAALPGAQNVALSTGVPLDPHNQAVLAFEIEGEPKPPPNQQPEAEIVWVSPGYLETLGIPLLSGRALNSGDSAKAPQAILVNQAWVRKYLKGGEAVGRRIMNFRNGDDLRTIVGVVGDVHTQALDRIPEPQILVPRAQWGQPFTRVLIRTAHDPMTLAPLVRAEVLAVDRNQPVAQPQTLEKVIAESLGERRFQMLLLSGFGAIALLLASIGIYGLVAYSVTQRSKEIGIRMALGAQGSTVLRMVVVGGLRLAAIGVGIGLVGAVFVTQALQRALYGVRAVDPLTFAAVSLLLVAVAALASWAPARKAARLDPMISLRAE